MRARLIKREEISWQGSRSTIQQNSHGQLEAQAPALTGIAAIRIEVRARMTTSERQRQDLARKSFNDLFAERS